MKFKKIFIPTILTVSMITLSSLALSGCGQSQKVAPKEEPPVQTTTPVAEDVTEEVAEATANAEPAPLDDVTIVYTNDSHTFINNMIKDEDGNEIRGLSFASVAAYVNEKRAAGENVLLVDAGDHIQGTAFGGLDEGASIIRIMNAAGYQAAAVGNHEFDYGQFRFFKMIEEANYPYLSCNFYNVADKSLVLPAYEIFEAGNTKVAIVGISTPETYTKSTPVYFQNENGEFIYGFFQGQNGQELYDSVQRTLDEVKDQADYVIGLAHLGVDPSSVPYTSREVIEHTTGFDAVIDGHSHTDMECENVTDASGNTVVLTQTGCYLGAFGDMKLSDGKITCTLVNEYDGIDPTVAGLENDWIASVNEQLGEKIAVSDNDFYMTDPKDPEVRLIRRMDTNLGELCPDAVYWYLNEKEGLDCDIAISNGGGIRSNIEAGDLTYLTAKTVHPYGNIICLINVTGQQIKDALEMGARAIGLKDEESGAPAECGGFLHVAGLTYSVKSSTKSSLTISDEGLFMEPPSGDYKVYDIKVYNRESHEYEPIDLEKTYALGGINYTLRNSGDGMSMFADSELELDYITEDYLCLAEYLKAFGGTDADGYPHISTENSPLSAYENYMIDYENPMGSGRITIK